MKSVAQMPAAAAFAGVGAIVAVLFFAPIQAAASTNKDEARKEFDEKLDHYAEQAKDMTQRAQKQMQQLQNDAVTLMDRWASEVANKQLAQFPPWEGKFTGVVGCTQPTGPGVRISGTQDSTSPVPISSFSVNPPAIPPATYSSAQFETWKKVELGFFAQSQKRLDVNLKLFLALLDDRRKRLDQIDLEATQPNKGVNWKAFQYQGAKAGILHDPNRFFTDAYRIVVTAYAELLYLHVSEISGSTRRTKAGLLSPPGLKCLIDFQQSSLDYADYARLQMARQSEVVTDPTQTPRYGLVCDQPCQSLRTACASDEQSRRDTAVSQFRPIRDRYYAERSPIRDRLLAWRKEGVGGGFYEGTGDADAAVVYGKESDLSPDNVYSLRIPYDDPTHVYYLRVPRAHAQSALDVEDKEVDSGWEDGALVGHGIGEISIYLNTECIRETSPAGSHLTAKYPDLEVESPFVLVIPTRPRTGMTPVVQADSSQRNPRVYLYAITPTGLQAIDDLYVGVPTIVELQFEPPYDKPTFDFEISAGGDSLKLTAKQVDQHGRIYRTDPFMPVGTKSDTGPAFNPPNGAPK